MELYIEQISATTRWKYFLLIWLWKNLSNYAILCAHHCLGWGLGLLENSLCYYSYSTVRSMPFRIWVMKEYGVDKPWTKLMQIPTHNIRYKMSLMPKLIPENGKVLMILDAKDFLIYNPNEIEYRTVFKSRTILRCAAVVTYSETLVPPEFSSGNIWKTNIYAARVSGLEKMTIHYSKLTWPCTCITLLLMKTTNF